MTHKIMVVFTVDTEQTGPWSSMEVALDHIEHVIDEGYTFEGEWEFVPSHEALKAPPPVKADPESYPQARETEGPVQPQG